MRLKRALSALFILTTSTCFSLVESTINEKASLAVTFSHHSHNRISIENGSVEKIIGDPRLFDVTLDKATGNAFINLLRPIDQVPKAISVVTSSGTIQDLMVSSTDGLAEHVVLKEGHGTVDQIDRSLMLGSAPVVNLLNQLLEGKTPLGYGTGELQEQDFLSLPKPLKAIPLKVLVGAFDKIVLYRIENQSRRPVVLSADALTQEHHSWVFLNISQLAAKQHALCLMAYHREQ